MLNLQSFNDKVNEIINSLTTDPYWKYDISVYSQTDDERNVKAVSMDMYKNEKDFDGKSPLNMYSDVAVLVANFYKKDVITFINKYKDYLVVVITANKINPQNPESATKVIQRTFSATVMDHSDTDLDSNEMTVDGFAEVDTDLPEKIKFQLREPSLEDCRMVRLAGIYKKSGSTLGLVEVLEGLMSYKTQGLSKEALSEPLYTGVRGVDVAPIANSSKYKRVIVEPKHNVSLPDLPSYLHGRYGLYATGLGYYLLNGIWYIYPTRDKNRYDSPETRTLTIYNVPKQKALGVDNTYRVDDSGNVEVVCAGDTMNFDVSSAALEAGNSISFVKATGFLDNGFHSDGNMTKAVREEVVSEFTLFEKSDGRNKVVRTKEPITDNPYPELCTMAESLGSFAVYNWLNSDPSLLYPGMPVRVYSGVRETVSQATGVLCGVSSTVGTTSASPLEERASSQSMLRVFLSKD